MLRFDTVYWRHPFGSSAECSGSVGAPPNLAGLHQLSSGTGAQPTAEQLERLASVLGVNPGYFAEYRLWRARALLDPGVVGFDRAMANFDRLRGRRGIPFERDADGDEGPRYPGQVSSR